MLVFVTTVILYVFGFVFLYGVIRLGVRHGIEDVETHRVNQVRAEELAGIAVWFDRDSDGVSGPGEVVPVEELGIAALSTEATGHVGLSPANPLGLELADGRRLPTWDWVTSPCPAP